MMVEKEKAHSYSVYLEGARAPMELNMSAGKLEGHTVHLKYNPSNSECHRERGGGGEGGENIHMYM